MSNFIGDFLVLLLCLLSANSLLANDFSAEEMLIQGDIPYYQPQLKFHIGDGHLQIPLSATLRSEDMQSTIFLDKYNHKYDDKTIYNTQFILGVEYEAIYSHIPLIIVAEYEHEFLAGVIAGEKADVNGVGMPNGEGYHDQILRKAFIRLSYGANVTAGGGFMSSHWGLGLISNNGEDVWNPGSAIFTDPRNGDLVLRGFLATGPHTKWDMVASLFADRVREDDNLLDGDEAKQAGGAFIFNKGSSPQIGLYMVRRWQKNATGSTIDANVVDLYLNLETSIADDYLLSLKAEGAYIAGKTTLGATVDFPTHKIRQVALAARASLDTGKVGLVFDFLFASGDNNYDDEYQTAFKTDPNFSMGFLFFRYVMAAQTARIPVNASDPDLIGYPQDGLDRIPTRGSASNTVALFPRLWWRPVDGLEIYGGAMAASQVVDYTDPFNTKIEGGTPRNPLNGKPGTYYGTEFDLGLRFRGIIYGSQFNAGLEGGLFVPGPAGALVDHAGKTMAERLYGARVILSFQL